MQTAGAALSAGRGWSSTCNGAGHKKGRAVFAGQDAYDALVLRLLQATFSRAGAVVTAILFGEPRETYLFGTVWPLPFVVLGWVVA